MEALGKWKYSNDRDSTILAYSKVESGGSENCQCNGCRNFVAARNNVFNSAFLSLLNTLGIDPLKDAEVYHCARMEPGKHHYGGWFHFVGNLYEDGDFPMVKLGEDISVCLSIADAPRLASFKGLQAVQLSFYTDSVPWVLNEKEPE